MLKKILLPLFCLGLISSSYAQKANVRLANKELDKANAAITKNDEGQAMLSLQKAKTAIEEAIKDNQTKEDPQTWITRATIYASMQGSSINTGKPYLTAYQSLNKAFELDKKYEKRSEVIPTIVRTSFYAFNDGIAFFNKSQYDSTITAMSKVLDLLGQEVDKRFSDQKDVDTIRVQAKMISGYSYFYSDQYDQAINFLEDCVKSSFLGNDRANVYLLLAQSYEKKGDSNNQLATINAGKKAFPTDENLKNAELNFYLSTGNSEELIKRFKENVEAQPNEPQNYYNLGILYEQLANPKDGSIPNNKAELLEKAEKVMNKAISISPDDPQMNYQLGAHYYNQAANVNNEMNQLPGSEMSKYNQMKKQRDQLFEKAIPLFEKSKSLYAPQASSLTGQDKEFYISSLEALAQIFTIQDKLDEAAKLREQLKNY